MSSSSDSDSDDARDNKFKEAVDPQFSFGGSNGEKCKGENGEGKVAKATMASKEKSRRKHSSNEYDDEYEETGKRDFQSYVAERLTKFLDGKIHYKDRKKKNDESQSPSISPDKDGIRLIRGSKKNLKIDEHENRFESINLHETAQQRILNKNWKERKEIGKRHRKESGSTSSDSEDETRKRIQESAVSADWIVKQSSLI